MAGSLNTAGTSAGKSELRKQSPGPVVFEPQKGFTEFMKQIIFILMITLSSFCAKAEPFQDAFRYGTYGLVAGALGGGTSMALSEDPGSHLTPVARGASLGLYAGLLIAVVKNMGSYKEPKFDIQPIGVGSSGEQGWGLAFYKRF